MNKVIEVVSCNIELNRRAIADPILRPCLYLEFRWRDSTIQEELNELNRCCRFLPQLPEQQQIDIRLGLASRGWCLLVFDSEENRDEFYKLTDGDDTGGSVYALTFDANGQTLNENT